MHHQFKYLQNHIAYDVFLVLAADSSGRAAIISIVKNGEEVGSIKLIPSLLEAVFNWSRLNDEQFLGAAKAQFLERGLFAAASNRSVKLEMEWLATADV
jgi:hypothetical protein